MLQEEKFCLEILPKVSRTFALSISKLKENLKREVCVSYLICRILDTIEDSPSLSIEEKNFFILEFLQLLKDGKQESLFFKHLAERLNNTSSTNDVLLVSGGENVVTTFCECRLDTREVIFRWVEEMGKGMVLYCKKMEKGNGIKTIATLSDLNDYCYYIAGTVGYMLTNLFYLNCSNIDKEKFNYLNERANDFGLALQKVNILKDVKDDYKRGWCFLPEDLLKSSGLNIDEIEEEEKGILFFEALRPLLEGLFSNMEKGFEYLLSIPNEEKEIRLFLATSLFFALATVELLVRKRKDFTSEKKLKISRLQVANILNKLENISHLNDKLQSFYLKLNKTFKSYLL